jgi:hypothetical protein
MIDFIKAIAHNTKMPSDRLEDLEELFAHLNEMNTMRDQLVHHNGGLEIDYDIEELTTRYITQKRVSRKGNEKTFKVGSTLVNTMYPDLMECYWRLKKGHLKNSEEPFKPYRPTGKRHTWLYKSPQPNSQWKRSARSGQ